MGDLRGPNLCAVITPDQVEAVTSRLGPTRCAQTPTPRRMAQDLAQLAQHRRLLMDQSVLAGVGNVYRSEVLFRQRVALPPRKEIRRSTWETIWNDLVELLPLGVATGKIVTVTEQVEQVRADLARGEVDPLEERTSYVYRRAGEACRVCGSRVRTRVVAGRNLFARPLPAAQVGRRAPGRRGARPGRLRVAGVSRSPRRRSRRFPAGRA